MTKDHKRPAVGKLWLVENLEVLLRRQPPPPEGGGDESVHPGSNSKTGQAGTAVVSRRSKTRPTDYYKCACHPKVEASMAQWASLCRFCVFPWSRECTGVQDIMQAP